MGLRELGAGASVLCSTQTPQTKAEYAAQLACQEHQLWREPFINAQGQLLKFGLMEAERDALSDSTCVAACAALLAKQRRADGFVSRATAARLPEVTLNEAITRAQIVDTPWSGAFVSYLMRTAGFSESEFHLADGHIRYIKAAYAAQPNGAFHLRNPQTHRCRLVTCSAMCAKGAAYSARRV